MEKLDFSLVLSYAVVSEVVIRVSRPDQCSSCYTVVGGGNTCSSLHLITPGTAVIFLV
jgi:hypothetical protein